MTQQCRVRTRGATHSSQEPRNSQSQTQSLRGCTWHAWGLASRFLILYKLGGAGRPPRALRAHVSSWLRSIGLRGSASLYCIHSLLWREHSYINYAYACFIIHDSEAPHAHMVHTLRHCVVLSFAEQGRTASAFCALLSHK